MTSESKRQSWMKTELLRQLEVMGEIFEADELRIELRGTRVIFLGAVKGDEAGDEGGGR